MEIFAVFSLDASKPFIISMFTISEAARRMVMGAWLAVDQTLSGQSMWTRSPLVSFTYNTMESRIVIVIPVSAGTDSVASFCHGVLVFFQISTLNFFILSQNNIIISTGVSDGRH